MTLENGEAKAASARLPLLEPLHLSLARGLGLGLLLDVPRVQLRRRLAVHRLIDNRIPSVEEFAKHGLTYTQAAQTTSDNYLELVPHVTPARWAAGPARPLRELRGLVRKRGASGRDRVDHRTGAHDDQAAAVAGALYWRRQVRPRSTRAPSA